MRVIAIMFVLAGITAHGGNFVYTNSVPWIRLTALASQNGGTADDYRMMMETNGTRIDSVSEWVTAANMDAVDVVAATATQAATENLPTTFRSGVAVPIPDADGHYMLLQPQGDGQPVVAIQISDSPIDPQAWRARRDATMARLEADRVTRAAEFETRKTKAKQSAQGTPAQVRDAMADMQAQIDALRAIVEAGR